MPPTKRLMGGLMGQLRVAGGVAFAVVMAIAGADARGATDEVGEVVITGSRIARDGFAAPTPVTVIGQERLEQRGFTNVADALNELPSFRALVTPATQQAAGGNIGARVLDLRGLGATRTLVLLDGKRFVPSTTQGTIDVNLIPSALIARTEVVTGGASAAYGSDAVAGVVNFLLDREMQGFRGSVQYGGSSRGDAEQTTLSLAWGSAFAGGRGHLLVGGEYDKSEGLGDCYTRRDWCPNEMLVGNSRAGDGGYPASVRAGPDATGNVAQNGLVNSGTLAAGGASSLLPRGITFTSNGQIRPYQYGQIIGNSANPLFTIGGEGTYENGFLQGILLMPPVERATGYGHVCFDLTDDIHAGFDLSYGRVQGKIIGSQARDAAFAIARNNAYLPSQLGAFMDTNGLSAVAVGRV
ncbi:MAG: TonB-dependent receptor plug domain-containing protein, partial [Steroidobacteraceae bacterium]